MSRNLYEPTRDTRINQNRYKIKDTRQKPAASQWITPVNAGDPIPLDEPDYTPSLQAGALQPTSGDNLQKFSFRLHFDGSIEFKGVLDLAGSTSPANVVILPGAAAGEPDYIGGLDDDQPWDSIISDDNFATFTLAQFYLEKATGILTITWPAS